MPVFGVKEWNNRYKSLKFGSQIAIFGHETWNLKKGPEVAYGSSTYPRGSKLSLFSLYGQRFPRYGPILKSTIFGHETWNLEKGPEVT